MIWRNFVSSLVEQFGVEVERLSPEVERPNPEIKHLLQNCLKNKKAPSL